MEALRERFGKYHVIAKIAQGGMAEVYKVKTVGIAGFEKIQALKRILPAQAGEARFIRSFVDEARIAVELTHRNIVQVFDFGKADGELFLAMELIEGKDLRTAMAEAVARDRLPPVAAAAYILGEVAAGLDYAHRKTDGYGGSLRIVHCDVSPSNVMLSTDGYVKILDFGVARATFASALERRRLRGKPRYMAPEQTLGEPPTAASDVFALGIIGWELVTGLPLYRGVDLKSTLEAVRGTTPARVEAHNPSVPRELGDAIARALARDPEARGTAADLGAACARLALRAGAPHVASWLAELEPAPEATPGAPPGATQDLAPHAPRRPSTTAIDGRAVLRGSSTALDAPRRPSSTALDARPPERWSATYMDVPPRFAPDAPDGATLHGLEPPDPDSVADLALDDVLPSPAAAPPPPVAPPARPTPLPAALAAALEPIDDELAAPPRAPTAERRRAVVVAAALGGAPAAALRPIARGLGELAYQRGGVVIGGDGGDDALLVAFGLEVAGEDDVAIAMGWALDAAALARDSQDGVHLQVGARTGVLTTGGVVPADAAEEARALAREAAPDRPRFVGGSDRVTSGLYALREVPASRRPERMTRGRAPAPGERGPVIEVLGPRGFDELDRARRAQPGPLFGRAAPLAQLEGALAQAAALDRRIAVRIVGGAGTGKTRLVAELVARHPEVRVVTVAATPASRFAPFAVVVDVYQAALGLAPGRGRDPRARAAERLVHLCVRAGIRPERARAIAMDLARAMELRDGAAVSAPEVADLRPRISAGLASFRAAVTDRTRPLVTIVEDVHHADHPSLEVLRHILAVPAAAAELLVLTERSDRPEASERAAPLPAVDATIALGDLVGAELRALIADRLGPAATPAAIAAVLARGGGNPLFVEELAAAVRVAGPAADAVPATARDVMAARIDRLSPAAKRALRLIAILGAGARAPVVEELVDEGEASEPLADALAELAAAGLLIVADDALTLACGLVGEVAYAALPPRAQREAHARVGRLLASRFFAGRDEPPAVIAEHLERAGEAAGAAAFWLRAARLARAAGDADAAIACATRCLDREAETGAAPPTAPARTRRRAALALREEAHRLRGDLTADAGDLDALAALCDAEPARLCDVALRRAQRHLRHGDHDAAAVAIDAARRAADAADDDRLRGEALQARAELAERRGRLDDALADVAAAIAAFGRVGAAAEESAAAVDRGRVLVARGRYGDAQAALAPVLARVAATGELALERVAQGHLAMAELCLGRFEAAMVAAQRALDLCRRAGDRAREAEALRVIGVILSEVGLAADAAVALRQAHDLATRASARWTAVACLIAVGACEARLGGPGPATLDEAVAQARAFGAPALDAAARVARADAALQAGALAPAIEDARLGAAVARSAGLVAHEIAGLARLALGLARSGAHAEAAPLALRAESLLATQRHLEGSEEAVHLACAEVLAMCGDRDGARVASQAARVGFARKLAGLTDPAWRAAFAATQPAGD